MAREYRLISADGHMVEPPDMWTKYLPKKFHDRAPKLVKDEKGGDAWQLVPGTAPMPLGLVTNAGTFGKRYEELEWFGATYDTILQGSFVGQGAPRGAGLRRRGRRGAVPFAADHGRVHGPGGRRLPPGRARGLQHLDARRVHGGGPRTAHRAGPDARRRHPDLGQVAARRQGGGVPGRDHLGLPVGKRRALRRRRPVLGGRPGGADARSTSTVVCARPASARRGRSSRRRRA